MQYVSGDKRGDGRAASGGPNFVDATAMSRKRKAWSTPPSVAHKRPTWDAATLSRVLVGKRQNPPLSLTSRVSPRD